MKRFGKFLKVLHFIFTIYLILFFNFGIHTYLQAIIPDKIGTVVILFYVTISILSKRSFFEEYLKKCWPLIVLLIIILISQKFSTYRYLINYRSGIINTLAVFTIYIYYKDVNENYVKAFLLIWFFDLIFIGINSIIQLNNNPYIMRMLSTGKIESIAGVGSYSYIYILPPLIILLIDRFKKTRNLVILPFICLFIYVIFRANFVISYIMLFIFLLFYLLSNIEFKYKPIVLIIIIPILLFVTFTYTPIILDKIVYNNKIDYLIRDRAKEMLAFFSGESINGSDLHSRIKLYTMSIESFRSNILFGSFGNGNIGGHAVWLDLLGLYGLLSIFWWIFVLIAYKLINQNISKENFLIYRVIILYYITLGLINTALFLNLLMFIFVISPLILKKYENHKGEVLDENIMDC